MAIDSGCATVAEVRKRGHEFWGEFEFYLSDLVVGLVLDVVLVSLLAPAAVIGAAPKTAAASGEEGGVWVCRGEGKEWDRKCRGGVAMEMNSVDVRLEGGDVCCHLGWSAPVPICPWLPCPCFACCTSLPAAAAGVKKLLARLPSAVFERSGVRKFTALDRLGCYLIRGAEYSLAGIACGFVGQGAASGMMQLK